MKHIVSLSPQLELIYVEAAKVLDTSIDEILCSVLEEYKANKEAIETQRKLLEASLKNCKKTENIENDFKTTLKTVYEKLIDENISAKEKFNISHTIIDKVEFDKSAQTLYLSYKYQM